MRMPQKEAALSASSTVLSGRTSVGAFPPPVLCIEPIGIVLPRAVSTATSLKRLHLAHPCRVVLARRIGPLLLITRRRRRRFHFRPYYDERACYQGCLNRFPATGAVLRTQHHVPGTGRIRVGNDTETSHRPVEGRRRRQKGAIVQYTSVVPIRLRLVGIILREAALRCERIAKLDDVQINRLGQFHRHPRRLLPRLDLDDLALPQHARWRSRRREPHAADRALARDKRHQNGHAKSRVAFDFACTVMLDVSPGRIVASATESSAASTAVKQGGDGDDSSKQKSARFHLTSELLTVPLRLIRCHEAARFAAHRPHTYGAISGSVKNGFTTSRLLPTSVN